MGGVTTVSHAFTNVHLQIDLETRSQILTHLLFERTYLSFSSRKYLKPIFH